MSAYGKRAFFSRSLSEKEAACGAASKWCYLPRLMYFAKASSLTITVRGYGGSRSTCRVIGWSIKLTRYGQQSFCKETKNCNGIFKPPFSSSSKQNCSIFETALMTKTKVLPVEYCQSTLFLFLIKRNVEKKVGKVWIFCQSIVIEKRQRTLLENQPFL